MSVALITGASRGLGRALARGLAERGWALVLDARGGVPLREVAAELSSGSIVALEGDLTDSTHRRALVEATRRLGGLDLLVNNASELGPSPMPELAEYPEEALAQVFRTNVLAPLDLTRLAMALLVERRGTVVNVSSDAGVEAYPRWGGYGASKAALDHASRILAAERPELRVYAFDPGDMRTEMHQRAFPGEDISDRPDPETVVPALLSLLDEPPASGRYRASDLLGEGSEGGREERAEAPS